MDFLGRKRKGPEILPAKCRLSAQLAVVWSHLSLKEYSRRKKKCKEDSVNKAFSLLKKVVSGIATAPPCGSLSFEPAGRGLKRKIGCIDVATRMGRKKKIEQDYDLGEQVGKGKFGLVVLCRSKVSGDEFACKALVKGEEIVHKEVEIMQHLSGHPGIVTLKAVYETDDCFHLVMELCSEGRLLDQMGKKGRYTEKQAAFILKDLVSAIQYCHDMGVVHRDIKPENILLTAGGKLKLADFGLATRIAKGQSLSSLVGSPAYVAPEVLTRCYSEKVDIWSAGVLLFALLVGVLPFHGSSLENVFESIKKAELDFNSGVWENMSLPCRDLIAKMLTRDVSARLSALEILRHPWISLNTELSLKPDPKIKCNTHLVRQQHTVLTGGLSKRNRIFSNETLQSDPVAFLSSSHSTQEDSDKPDSNMVDALTVAIANLGISEPKRSRLLYNSASTAQQNYAVNLCKAF